MSFKTTYLLFAVLLAMLGLLGLTLALKKTNSDPGALFPSFTDKNGPVDATEINTVEIERKNKDKLVFVKDRRGWRLERLGLTVDHSINTLIRQVMEARREEDTDVTSNPEQWGLKEPAMVVVLKKGTREWKLKLGKQSPDENGVVYAMSSDRPGEVMAVRRSDLASAVNFKFDQIWSRELLKATPFITRELTVSGPVKEGAATKDQLFTLRRKKSGTYWFVAPPFGPAEMEAGMFDVGAKRESPGVRGLLLAINDLQAEGLEPFDQHEPRWYGLGDGAKVARIAVKNVEGGPDDTGAEEETLLVKKKIDKKNGKDVEQYYARLSSGQAVFRVPAKKVEAILSLLPEEGERLRSLQVIQLRPTEPDAVDIHTARGDLQLRRVRMNDWKLKTASTGTQKADHVLIQQLLAELATNHQVKGFHPSGKNEAVDKALGLSPGATSITIWVGGLAEAKKDIKKDAKKAGTENKPKEFPSVKGRPAVKLVFGSSEGKAYVKREVEGEINRVEVPVPLLKRVESVPETYLDRTLASFAVERAIGLVRSSDGKTIELARADKDKTWKLVGPRRPSGRVGVDVVRLTGLLGQLARIGVEQWVQVKPDAADLKSYKLDNPHLKIEVKIVNEEKKEPTALTFSFGETKTYDKSKTGVTCLARLPQGGQAVVFLVDPALVPQLKTIELRDRTVFHFSESKVERLTLKGMEDIKKPAQVGLLDLNRDADMTWKVGQSSQTGFKVDEQKVQKVLAALSALELERLVDDPLAKEHDLANKDNRRLTIEIFLKDEKKPLTLVIGKQKGQEPFLFATSSSLEGEVFMLPVKGVAEILANSPWIGYFKKAEGS